MKTKKIKMELTAKIEYGPDKKTAGDIVHVEKKEKNRILRKGWGKVVEPVEKSEKPEGVE